MYELTPKKQRAMETMEKLLNLLPPPQKLMVTAFMPQCRQSLTNIPDEDIDRLIGVVRDHIDYIENGGEI